MRLREREENEEETEKWMRYSKMDRMQQDIRQIGRHTESG